MLSNLIPVALALMTAVAQPTAPQVTHVEGTATLDRGHIRTSGGRIEMVWPDGTVLHVDAATDLRLEDSGTVAVADGRLVLRTAGATVRLQAPYALLTLDPYGIYSIVVDTDRERLLVRVSVGSLRLHTRYGSTTELGPRQLAMMTSATTIPWAAPFEPNRWDAFDAWSDKRASARWANEGGASRPALDDRSVDDGSGAHAGQGCSGFPSLGAPCWWLPGTVPPGPPSYTPSLPNYAPTYTPNYGPGSTPSAPPPPARLPSPGLRTRPRPPAATPTVAPAPPASATPAGGNARGVRVPERPDLR